MNRFQQALFGYYKSRWAFDEISEEISLINHEYRKLIASLERHCKHDAHLKKWLAEIQEEFEKQTEDANAEFSKMERIEMNIRLDPETDEQITERYEHS